MKVKTIVTVLVKATVMVAAPGGFFLAGYEVWKWWKHRHDQKPAEALENRNDEKSESVQAEDDVDKEVSEEKVN